MEARRPVFRQGLSRVSNCSFQRWLEIQRNRAGFWPIRDTVFTFDYFAVPKFFMTRATPSAIVLSHEFPFPHHYSYAN